MNHGGSNGPTSIFQTSRRRSSGWAEEDEDEEKMSPEKQELVRRVRIRRAHKSEILKHKELF